MIPVTRTFIPPIEDYSLQVKRAFETGWLSNSGLLLNELKNKIIQYLKLENTNAILMTNGTLPLQIAAHLLGKNGEIITTPFSHISTTSSILWEHCQPVFVDIHPEFLTIDETKIESVITDKTTCVLATHVFGNPCNVMAIESIAKKYNLKVIYDAAHCFGVQYLDQSVFSFGDISTCSFHATKLFHCGEGGASFCKDLELANAVYYSHNFGIKTPYSYHGVGINAKMSELQAAMGLTILPYVDSIISDRKRIISIYKENLIWSNLKTIKIRANTEWNNSYFPIIFNSEAILLEVLEKLKTRLIFPKRYFYPAIHTLDFIQQKVNLEVAESISQRIVCLPLYTGLDEKTIKTICDVINSITKKH